LISTQKEGSHLEFNQLETFIQVVKHKSFSKAAKDLYLTQPTISNNIQNLEKQLGATLLDRSSKNISLTEAGKLLFAYAEELVNIRDQAQCAVSEYCDQMEGTIHINASSIPEQYVLPYIIQDFLVDHPKIRFSVTHKNTKELIDDILDGKESYGIVGAKHCCPTLEYIRFFEDELVVVVPCTQKYSAPNYTEIDLEMILSEPFILRKEDSGTRQIISERLLERKIKINELNIVSTIDSNEMIKKMIELGLGVSILSKMAVEKECALKQLKRYRIKNLSFKRPFYFVYHKNRTLSPKVDTFKNFLMHWPGIK
ncbi:MAG TPA: LysR family transcriptional regulator, partial [Eubacteriaceae bacterium]|nr:LysR family transcriptional regulator [Eubacteriaceae bacterium]